MTVEPIPAPSPRRLRALLDSDALYDLLRSPVTLAAALTVLVLGLAAAAAPLLASQNPFDPAQVDLLDAMLPPAWTAQGRAQFPFGTDDQGRDLLSAILYGLRTSLVVGVAAVALGMAVGVTLGLVAGFVGGRVDALIMRAADVAMTFPNILVALLIDGLLRTALPRAVHDEIVLAVLVVAIGLPSWVQYARTVRGSTLVERDKDYVLAAEIMGRHRVAILFRHVLPNVIGPVLVIATLGLAVAIISEATLSFLGVGLPPTQPSLGTMIRIGNEYLFSGAWWVAFFPAATLVVLSLAVNLLGDWLRDVFNPRLH